MKKTMLYAAIMAFLIAVCVSSGKTDVETLSFDQAILASAQQPGLELQERKQELSRALVNEKAVTVVERRQLDLVRKELDSNMTGEVSDKSALSIGNMLGAKVLISDSLSDDGPVPEGLEYEVIGGNSVTITRYNGRAASIAIPARIQWAPVTAIGSAAFFSCSSLTSISIPSSVTTIGEAAFSGCSSLTSISIPSSVTTIERTAFYGCSSLTSISIPASVTSIRDWAFEECSSLSSVTLSRRTKVESAAFPATAKLNYSD